MSFNLATLTGPTVLFKLKFFKISDSFLKWLKSFFSDRLRTVNVNNEICSPLSLAQSVPQGSVISPILRMVILYGSHPRFPLKETSIYADDL